MSEMEKIQRYIDKTEFDTSRWQMRLDELFAFRDEAEAGNLLTTICAAFDYGRAKGYRAAKAEVRK